MSLAVVGTLLIPDTSWARHTDDEHITEYSAHVLRRNEWRVGVWRIQYGTPWNLEIGTYTVPWALQFRSFLTKWKYYETGDHSLAAGLNFIWWDFAAFEEAQGGGDDEDEASPEVTLLIVPFEGSYTYRWTDSLKVSSQLVYTQVTLSGGDGNKEVFNGAVALSNLQSTFTLEWRWSDVTALEIHTRFLIATTTEGTVKTTVPIDDYTEAEIEAEGETDALDFQNLWSIVPTFHWSWDTYNLRMGLGYGNWNLPIINFTVPVKTPIVELDMFWRF